MSSRSLPRLSVGVELLTRMALLGWVLEKMGKVGEGSGDAARSGGLEQGGGEDCACRSVGKRGPGAKQAFIAQEGLSAGRQPWRCGGAPRGPAPLGGGAALGCAGATKACGFAPMGALRPGGVGRRSD